MNGQVDPKTYLKEVAERIHQVPHHGEKRIAAKTILDWCTQYKKGGFEALKPKRRSDRGHSRRLSPEEEEHILALRKKHPHMPVTVFYQHLIEQGEIQSISYFTIYRLLKKYNLVGKEILPIPERKRFAYDQINELWQGDLSHGPLILDRIMEHIRLTTFLHHIAGISQLSYMQSKNLVFSRQRIFNYSAPRCGCFI